MRTTRAEHGARGKHRKPRRRSITIVTRPPVLVGTAALAVVGAAWLPPAGSAHGEVRAATAPAGTAPTGPAQTVPATEPVQPVLTTEEPASTFSVVAPAHGSRDAHKVRTLLQRELTERRHFDAAAYWVKPVVQYQLTAHFGESSSLWAHRHTGQDFAAPVGTPVRAASEGVVVSAEPAGPYGNRLVIRHAGGVETWYCHLSAFVARPGEKVQAGQEVAKVGATGNTTGPHLHFEVRPRENDPIDPIPWLRSHGVLV